MVNDKRLNADKEEELFNLINRFKSVENFKYNISEDGKEITLSGRMGNTDSERIYDIIENIENMLNVKYKRISSVNGYHSFTYEFI